MVKADEDDLLPMPPLGSDENTSKIRAKETIAERVKLNP